MKINILPIILLSGSIITPANLFSQQNHSTSSLSYNGATQNQVPIPPSEQTLQTVTADYYFKVTEQGHSLEGAIFDDKGNLLF